jgi:Domain of unknown function (DUF6602)
MSKKGLLKFQVPTQGWKQFLTARKIMLDSFDKARILSRSHKVETSHGNVAEAEYRNWLNKFLPKKYGVTSGYIISPGISDLEKLPHYDVIIYEHLESPILWIENSPDATKHGYSLAIPAEYVKGIIEVKSVFKKSTVESAIKHLSELKRLLSGIDDPKDNFKLYLPSDFFCGLAFFELRKENQFDKTVLQKMFNGYAIKGFQGGVILRGEGHSKQATGILGLGSSETVCKNSTTQKHRNSLLNGYANSNSIRIKSKYHTFVVLTW